MTVPAQYRQPWIRNRAFDSLFILLPPFLALAIVAFLPNEFKTTNAMPLAGWVFLILFVDVAHVYSTLYNTYLDKERMRNHRVLFLVAPLVCFVCGYVLYSFGAVAFWRALAYLAVFHFIRQQYGFLRIYAASENTPLWKKRIDEVFIYSATIYPILHWHLTASRNFNWFTDADFVFFKNTALLQSLFALYIFTCCAYAITEVYVWLKLRHINIPRNLILAGTAISWYAGIVVYNGDLAFTLLNTVSHGLPYMALIWAGMQRNAERKSNSTSGLNQLPKVWYGVGIFLSSLVLLAFIEEGLWDGLVWREHLQVFGLFSALPAIGNEKELAILVPLLSLPQSTHYVLDGFIWKKKFK